MVLETIHELDEPQTRAKKTVVGFGPFFNMEEREVALREFLGEGVGVVYGGFNILGPENVVRLVEEHDAFAVVWNPLTAHWVVANELCDILDDMNVKVIQPVYICGFFSHYEEWSRDRRH